MLSNLREWTDSYRNIHDKGLSIEASLKDIEEDQEASRYGREQGRKYPNEDSRISVDKYRPNGLSEKY